MPWDLLLGQCQTESLDIRPGSVQVLNMKAWQPYGVTLAPRWAIMNAPTTMSLRPNAGVSTLLADALLARYGTSSLDWIHALRCRHQRTHPPHRLVSRTLMSTAFFFLGCDMMWI